MKAAKRDMKLRSKLFEFTCPEKIPVKYAVGDKEYAGIPNEFSPVVTRRFADADITEYTIKAVTPEKLELRVEYKIYNDFAAVEWVFYITNLSESESPVIKNFKVLDGTLQGESPRLLHGNGDNCNESGYSWSCDYLTETPIIKFPDQSDGNSCFGAFPYMRLIFENYSVKMAIGWTGSWESVIYAENDGAHITVGQKSFESYLLPGECVRTPSLTLLAADGEYGVCEDRIRNQWRSWYFAHLLPRDNGQPLPSKLVLHTWNIDGKNEFCGCTEKNQKEAIDTYIKKGMKPDIWWIDAGWYPCNDQWGTGTGNFFCNKENFPNGLGAVGEYCRKQDIQFLLWFEPERIYKGTWVYENKPEFLLKYNKENDWFNHNALFNLGSREACDWLIDTVDALIKEYHIDIYRQDFNFQPMVIWKDNETEGRVGILENLHIQGYYRFWDTLLERNPGLLIDSCSSGGKRNDIETMRRAVPFHYTDVGYGKHPIKQAQYRQMFEWIPYFRSHTMAWDNEDGSYGNVNRPVDKFSYLTVMTAPAITCMIEYYQDGRDFELGNRFNEIWRSTAEIALHSDYYPLTECRKSDEDWYAAQFENTDREEGIIHFIRNILCEEETITVRLHVDIKNLDRTYVLTDKFTGEEKTFVGRELMTGFTYSAPKRSGTVFYYKII